MFAKMNWIACLIAAVMLVAAPPAVADEAVDKAFEVLATYDWGSNRGELKPIDDAVIAAHGNAEAAKALEVKLAAVLGSDAKHAAKDYACRQLSLIGTAESVPALAALLTDEKLSHMARYALERMPCDEAVAAVRDALGKTDGKVKVGVINTLGVRRDAASTDALIALTGDSDPMVAGAAASALGAIGTPEAAKALAALQEKAPAELRLVAADAYLACAEKLLAAGKKADAMKIYQALSKSDIKHVGLAAKRGLVAAMGSK